LAPGGIVKNVLTTHHKFAVVAYCNVLSIPESLLTSYHGRVAGKITLDAEKETGKQNDEGRGNHVSDAKSGSLDEAQLREFRKVTTMVDFEHSPSFTPVHILKL
jgi:hypothetical protein